MIKGRFFVNWYKTNGRHFPWREEGTTPYQFLITEMLLRQTRASDVAGMWRSFISDYPDPESLVKASKLELFSRLKMLGFGEQKAEALQFAATYLIENHKSQVPNTLEELLKIPHIGYYSARAILCFAFGKKIEIVDTNVLRLFARYFGIKLKPDIRREPQAWEIAKHLLPREKKKAKAHNYGILDFTADICKPGKPRCEICPLNKTCVWGRVQLKVLNDLHLRQKREA